MHAPKNSKYFSFTIPKKSTFNNIWHVSRTFSIFYTQICTYKRNTLVFFAKSFVVFVIQFNFVEKYCKFDRCNIKGFFCTIQKEELTTRRVWSKRDLKNKIASNVPRMARFRAHIARYIFFGGYSAPLIHFSKFQEIFAGSFIRNHICFKQAVTTDNRIRDTYIQSDCKRVDT